MKLLVIAALFIVSVAGKATIESRITGGFSARSGLAKCYVSLVINGETSYMKYCGGCLISPDDRIVTSASCVFSLAEGKANNVKFYTGLSGPTGSAMNWAISDIYRPTGFDVNKNTSESDIAVVVLKSRVTTSSSFGSAWPSTEEKADAFVGEDLVACGHGFIDNNRTRPGSKGLQCTTLRAVPIADCVDAISPKPATPPKGVICTKNIDDRNVCGGDQGSPVFSNKTGSLYFVGVVSYYPNARANARCRDGHFAVVTQIGSYKDFLNDPKTNGAQ
jgi:secreted trypsin-like serine protease